MFKIFFIVYDKNLKNSVKRELEKDYVDTDRLFMFITIFQWFLVSTVSGANYGLYMMGFIGGGFATLLSFFSYKYYQGTWICRTVMGANCAVFTVLYITQNLGMIEAHFPYFIIIGLLLRYKDMLPLIVNTGIIVIHHFLFTYLQEINGLSGNLRGKKI